MENKTLSSRQAEEIERLDKAIDRLPRRQREIFLAIRIDDESYPEIAERMGISVNQVERQFADALVRLSKAMDEPTPVPWWKRLWRRATDRRYR